MKLNHFGFYKSIFNHITTSEKVCVKRLCQKYISYGQSLKLLFTLWICICIWTQTMWISIRICLKLVLSVKLVVRWADITQLEKNATLLLPDMVRVSTRSSEHVFSVFLNINETFKLMEQLANIAMRQLLDNKGFEQDRSLPKLKKKSPKKVSALKRSVPVKRI